MEKSMKHLLSTKGIKRYELEGLFAEAEYLESGRIDVSNLLKGKVLGFIKDEASTRTRVSFEVAMKRLGGEVTCLDLDHGSSILKGETVPDTIQTLSELCDVVVLRHSSINVFRECVNVCNVPFINAGDGNNEHPTQALLDAYTMKVCKNNIDFKNIMIVGDLKGSRTAHSLITLLSLYHYCKIHLVSPKEYCLPEEFKTQNLKSYNSSLLEALSIHGKDLDFLYMTRFQKERHAYDHGMANYYVLEEEELKYLSDNCKVLHPLPRGKEMPKEFDKDPRAVYFNKQIKNGMYIRMALLVNILTKGDFFERTFTIEH